MQMQQGRVKDRKSFLADEDGAVAAMYAIALTGLIVIAGAAFDYGRVASLDTELQGAADQAALAGVTQLDQTNGSCARAGNAAIELLRNVTLLGNDGGGNLATIRGGSGNVIAVAADQCDQFTNDDGDMVVQFFSDQSGTAATGDADARYIRVAVDERVARYAFTPLAELYGSDVRAFAVAGVGSAICEVPPLMVCMPPSSTPITKGMGIAVTGHGGGNTAWAPGDFGFLSIGSGQLANLVKALAYGTTNIKCTPIGGDTPPETGNAQDLFRAVNTRFDIYDFPDNNGTDLSLCFNNGTCPSASNAVKDLTKPSGTTGNACKLGNNGWELPPDADEMFWPKNASNITNPGSATEVQHDYTHSPTVAAMGLPRDRCHYVGFNSACAGDRFGDGKWARKDYWDLNHSGDTPPAGYGSMTRFETYKWEIDNGNLADNGSAAPECSPAFGGGESMARRVLPVAIVNNCSSLSGGSTNVQVGSWWNMFLVEAVVDGRDSVTSKTDVIYMEAIEPLDLGSGGGGPTISFRKDVPYLIE